MGNSFISGAPQALEHTELSIPTSTASRAVPTSVAADRSRNDRNPGDGSSATSRIGLAPSPNEEGRP